MAYTKERIQKRIRVWSVLSVIFSVIAYGGDIFVRMLFWGGDNKLWPLFCLTIHFIAWVLFFRYPEFYPVKQEKREVTDIVNPSSCFMYTVFITGLTMLIGAFNYSINLKEICLTALCLLLILLWAVWHWRNDWIKEFWKDRLSFVCVVFLLWGISVGVCSQANHVLNINSNQTYVLEEPDIKRRHRSQYVLLENEDGKLREIPMRGIYYGNYEDGSPIYYYWGKGGLGIEYGYLKTTFLDGK